MAFQVDGLMRNGALIDGRYVIARPYSGSFRWQRLKDAWLVLRGRADAVVFHKQ